ncbi:hypothetical protein J31TS4_20690 [Paenibacillus sp. J31TS4]|uniref:aspartyl-phosphate phosphatase Spo0E family protein n=1 Tax=Paenibacillus sp. J31TS4 TaxID=2807195 RepID=UPI001B1CDD93|nr:aspartyl-phosphate phosphatase Spo0E family protein [Paenibacillus sp. J31TS4]GIP38789.1 hypothetical protein J31TS4_20690 [Paenibacillus sp. J31TS4]
MFAYRRPSANGYLLLRENNRNWLSKLSPSHEDRLEEEIRELRMKMEQLYLEHGSLLSSAVIEISRLLDEKINEYINRTKNR